ncbi:MAG: hypothetical protein ACM3XM_12235 [Mycobacterium leprae]
MRTLLCRKYVEDAVATVGCFCGLLVGGLGLGRALEWSMALLAALLCLIPVSVRRFRGRQPEEAAPQSFHGWHWTLLSLLCAGFWIPLWVVGLFHTDTWTHSNAYRWQQWGFLGAMAAQGAWQLSWPRNHPKYGNQRWLGFLLIGLAGFAGILYVATLLLS